MKPLAQIAYESFIAAAPEQVLTWEQICSSKKQSRTKDTWERVVRDVVRELLAEQRRRHAALIDRPVVCAKCKARFMAGENHDCAMVIAARK